MDIKLDGERPFRVLTLDGGGMRGLYASTLLQNLAQRFNPLYKQKQPDIGKDFDLICGTSTGAILACALAAGLPLNKISKLYSLNGLNIFTSPMPKRTFQLYKWAWFNRNKPAANVIHLKTALTETFGQLTLKQLYDNRGIALCIPAVIAVNHLSKVFKTPHHPDLTNDWGYSLVDVCLSSSAAPILFPISKVTNPNNLGHYQYFVDGGLWANNPILVGLAEAVKITSANRAIEIISVGTCDTPTGDPNSVKNVNWGVVDWRVGVNILNMSLPAQSCAHVHMARFLAEGYSALGKNVKIVRLPGCEKSPEAYSAIGLDRADSTAIQTLISFAETDADHIHSIIRSGHDSSLSVVKGIFENLQPINEN